MVLSVMSWMPQRKCGRRYALALHTYHFSFGVSTIESNLSNRLQTSVCHCRPCRKISGATGSVNLAIPIASFALTKGELKKVRTTHIDEGFEFSIAFCGDCGSPIYGQPHPKEGPQSPIVVIQVGTLDDSGPLEAIPVQEINIKHRLPWVGKIDTALQKRTYVE